jgi:glycerophosphoryl diester phosphodiesterase
MSDWKSPHPLWIVGHRGAPRRARENTIASFDWAESFGVDAIELDVRQTREGEAVVFHDEDIALGSQRIPVRHFTAREIERLTFSTEFGDHKIPKLEEVFHRYGRTLRYVVEVKTAAGVNLATMARRVARLAAAYRVSDRCLVASFDAELLRKMRDADPAIATSFLFDHPVALPEPGRATPLFPPVDAIGPRKDLVAAPLLAQAAAANLSVHVWTVDEMEEVARLAATGVASVTTNAPDAALRLRDGEGREERHVALRPVATAEPVN